MIRSGAWFMVGAVLVAMLAACGQKGPPLPPLRPTPGRVADLSVRAIDDRVEFTFTIPATNADGTTPPALARVEIYGVRSIDPGPAPTRASILEADNLKMTIDVVPVPDPEAPRPAEDEVVHGAQVSVADRVGDVPAGTSLHYLAVGVVGRRRGAPSPIVIVSPALRPEAPSELLVEYDQDTVSLSWSRRAPEDAFHVYRATTAGEDDHIRLTLAPLAEPLFTTPVEFGRARCFQVRAVHVEGVVSIESPASPPVCLTAVDRFAPPPPTGLQAIAAAGGVTLSWQGVEAVDLAGYLVLRGDGTDETLVPLMAAPLAGVSYRDTTVSPGSTYTYAVVSVDDSAASNRSVESNRQVVTARRPDGAR